MVQLTFLSTGMNPPPTKSLDDSHWRLDDLLAVADGEMNIAVSDEPAWRAKMRASADFLQDLVNAGEPVYGVNTGYGESCHVRIPDRLIADMPLHLTRFHGCGFGRILGDQEALAVMTARAVSLAKGYSAIRLELLEHLVALIQHRVIPLIPAEGSVGASGDLTPLSYVAAVLVGERKARYQGRDLPAAEALACMGRQPLTLHLKEGLALMNGTSFMTGLAALALRRADYIGRLACRITAMGVEALGGHAGHYRPDLFALKAHPGQARAAHRIHSSLRESREADPRYPIQDRYSFRCAPHVIGVLEDALPWMTQCLEIELNSVNDNPIIDAKNGVVLHGGHFYGGHVAFVMDSTKSAVASICDLLDRQVALITDRTANHGLPANLSGADEAQAQINHGFKALQIAISAWTAEALKLTMPATSFSRSTECHNQDKVSMGSIAARDALRILELAEQVAAGALLIMQQGVMIRLRRQEISRSTLQPPLAEMIEEIERSFPFLEADRPLQDDIANMLRKIRARCWTLE